MNIIKVTENPLRSMKAEKAYPGNSPADNVMDKLAALLDDSVRAEAAARENVPDSAPTDFWWNKY